jgi:hypothetical protein
MRRKLLVLALLAACTGGSPALANEGKEKEEKAVLKPIFHVDPFSISVRKSGGRWGVLTVDVNLEAPDPKLRVLAEQLSPRLRAAYTQVLTGYGQRMNAGAPPDVEGVLMQMQQATDRTLGRKGAKVLLGGLTLQ